MTEIGKNAFCTEVDVVGIVPRYFGFANDEVAVPFNETKLFKDNYGKTYVNLFNVSVRRGANGMDNYDEKNNPIITNRKFPGAVWVIVVILCLFALMFLYAIGKCMCCPAKKRMYDPHYVKLTPEEEMALDWSKACSQQKEVQLEEEFADED